MSDQTRGFDRRNLKRSFDRAARGYDEAADLQRLVADNLLERLDYIKVSPVQILDAGTGTGYCARKLAKIYPRSRIYGLDLAYSMLRKSRSLAPRWRSPHHHIGGDIASLPLADHSIDLLISSLTLQWCTDLAQVFDEFRRVLKPGGLLLFSSFGPDTLRELRESWARVDTRVHVNEFVDMHQVGDAMVAAGFRDVVMDADRMVLQVDAVVTLMRNLKAIGAHNVQLDRPRGLTGKSRIRQLAREYDAWREDRMLPVTYEAVYAHAWAPELPGHVSIPFSPNSPYA